MKLGAFGRFAFVWLAVVALLGNALAQNQLGTNVVVATAMDARAAQISAAAVDHTGHDHHAHHEHQHHQHHADAAPADPAAHHAGHGGGHTHKGHADCALCGVVASIAAVTVPVAVDVPAVAPPRHLDVFAALHAAPRTAQYTPYASRAPPLTA